ncbi:MAG: HD domain-containing protein [Lachnospiraceae bacterium]|nr:HD domain-containing protein [Lachnospiraceae bacterium]
MLFVKTEDLKPDMRLAKPIYNKKGVLLFDRDTRITKQSIISIANFGLIGIYILEPAEPVPPMTEDDMEFERFQTVTVFSIMDDMKDLLDGKEPKNLLNVANQIIKKYGKLYKKLAFTQNLRSSDDYVYKHALNVAILSAMIAHKMKFDIMTQVDVVVAALLHDIGKLNLGYGLASKNDPSEEEIKEIKREVEKGYLLISEHSNFSPGVKRIISQMQKEVYDAENSHMGMDRNLTSGTKALIVADAYDRMTAMKLDEEPQSELKAIRTLLDEEDKYDMDTVFALLNSIQIMPPGACVEMSNGEKGLVISENTNPLEPMVLSFETNQIYDFTRAEREMGIRIKDIMKTMDNRTVIDRNLLKEYE